MFSSVRQSAAPGEKFAVSDCILFAVSADEAKNKMQTHNMIKK